MKKQTYQCPEQTVVVLSTQTGLLQASVKDITSNVGITGGGSDEEYTGGGRVKENFTNIWDNEW